MSFRGLKSWLIVAGVVWGALASAYSQSTLPRRGQPILFSEPKRDTSTTNLNQFATRKKSLQTLEDELKKPFDIFDMANPAANKAAPMPQAPPPNVNSKRVKELLEKRRDRGFESPEDLVPGLTVEEIFNLSEFGPDGERMKKKSKLERAYDRLELERAGNTNQMRSDDLIGSQEPDEDSEDLNLPGEKSPNPFSSASAPAAPTLKPLFGSDSLSGISSELNKTRSLSEIFKVPSAEPTETVRARETRLQDFRQLLDARALLPPAGGGSTFDPFKNGPTPGPTFAPLRSPDGLFGAASSDSLAPPPPPPSPSVSPGLAGIGDNRETFAPPPPPRTPPAFEIPRRKF